MSTYAVERTRHLRCRIKVSVFDRPLATSGTWDCCRILRQRTFYNNDRVFRWELERKFYCIRKVTGINS